MSTRPLVLVVDAADVLAASPEARVLVTELVRTGRRNGVVVRSEDRQPLWQHPTAAAFEAAVDRPE
jgi:hypothetical protein